MDAVEIIFPRNLLFLLRCPAFLLLRQHQAMEPLEKRQLGGRHHHRYRYGTTGAGRLDSRWYDDASRRTFMELRRRGSKHRDAELLHTGHEAGAKMEQGSARRELFES